MPTASRAACTWAAASGFARAVAWPHSVRRQVRRGEVVASDVGGRSVGLLWAALRHRGSRGRSFGRRRVARCGRAKRCRYWTKLRAWFDEQGKQALPKSQFGEALGYLRNQWTALTNYVQDGRLPIDNNATERDLRALTIGRKNWLFIGSPEAGPRAAIAVHGGGQRRAARLGRVGLLAGRAGAIGHPEKPYGESPPTPEKLTPLLPDLWAQAHPESVRDDRKREQASLRFRQTHPPPNTPCPSRHRAQQWIGRA